MAYDQVDSHDLAVFRCFRDVEMESIVSPRAAFRDFESAIGIPGFSIKENSVANSK